MAALTFVSSAIQAANRHHYQLEDRTIVNTTALAIARALPVPDWAHTASFVLGITATAGTTSLLDFKLEVVDPFVPDSTRVAPFGDWNGITQVTNTTNAVALIDCGPGITGIADDDTGSATASDRYAINAPLPRIFLYTLTLDGATGDEDYTFQLSVTWR